MFDPKVEFAGALPDEGWQVTIDLHDGKGRTVLAKFENSPIGEALAEVLVSIIKAGQYA